MTVTVGNGSYRYDVAEDWGKLPEGYEWGQIGAVAVDNQDRVHVCTRTEHPVLISVAIENKHRMLGCMFAREPNILCLFSIATETFSNPGEKGFSSTRMEFISTKRTTYFMWTGNRAL